MHRSALATRAGAGVQTFALALALGACAEVPVVQGVSEPEANRVMATLDQSGIAARKEASEASGDAPTFRITVVQDEVARAVTVLHANALPRREEPGFQETFGQASLVQSASEEHARASQAVSGELARSIESIEGVLDARVHLARSDARELALDGHAPPRSTASVLVRYLGVRAPYEESAIRRLVAGAVPGLATDDVTVIGVATARPPLNTEARLAWVGPIAVARGSATRLRTVLAGSLAINVLLAGAVAWAVLRRREERPDEDDGGRPNGR